MRRYGTGSGSEYGELFQFFHEHPIIRVILILLIVAFVSYHLFRYIQFLIGTERKKKKPDFRISSRYRTNKKSKFVTNSNVAIIDTSSFIWMEKHKSVYTVLDRFRSEYRFDRIYTTTAVIRELRRHSKTIPTVNETVTRERYVNDRKKRALDVLQKVLYSESKGVITVIHDNSNCHYADPTIVSLALELQRLGNRVTTLATDWHLQLDIMDADPFHEDPAHRIKTLHYYTNGDMSGVSRAKATKAAARNDADRERKTVR